MTQSRRRHDSTFPQEAGREITPTDVLILAGRLLQRHAANAEDGTAFSYETSSAVRVVIRLDNGMESDVDVDKVTQCFRGLVNGVEVGPAEMN